MITSKKLLRPSYAPPSAKVIAGELLNTAHQKLASEVSNILEDVQYNSIISDGWSNQRAEHMVNYVAITPTMKPILLATVVTAESSQAGEEIARGIEEQIEKVGM